MVLGRPVLLGGVGERVGQRAGQRPRAAVDAQLHARSRSSRERARQELARRRRQCTSSVSDRVAHAGRWTLALTAIATASSRSAARVHEHVAVARRGVQHRHRGVLLQRGLQPLAAARDDQVDDAVLRGELAQLVAVAAGHDRDRALRQARPTAPRSDATCGEHGVRVRPRSTSRAARSRCPTSGTAPSSRSSRSAAPRRPRPPRRAARARGACRARSRAGGPRSSRPRGRAARRSRARRAAIPASRSSVSFSRSSRPECSPASRARLHVALVGLEDLVLRAARARPPSRAARRSWSRCRAARARARRASRPRRSRLRMRGGGHRARVPRGSGADR